MGMQIGITSVERHLPISDTTVCIYTSIQNSHLGIYTEDPLPTVQKSTKLFTVALFISTEFGKLPKHPSIEDQLNKL